jgi:hypothetical protein
MPDDEAVDPCEFFESHTEALLNLCLLLAHAMFLCLTHWRVLSDGSTG